MRTVTHRDRISVPELRRLAAGRFGDMIKGVVDVERRILIGDADLHADQEAQSLRRYFDAFGVAAVNGRTRARNAAGS